MNINRATPCNAVSEDAVLHLHLLKNMFGHDRPRTFTLLGEYLALIGCASVLTWSIFGPGRLCTCTDMENI